MDGIWQILVLSGCFLLGNGAYVLEHIKSVYVPFRVDSSEEYLFNAGSVEQLAYNPDYPFMYTHGNNLLHVIDVSDVDNADYVYSIPVMEEGTGTINDVVTCRDWVAVTIDNKLSPRKGSFKLFTRYRAEQSERMRELTEKILGTQPDSAVFTKDCSKLIITMEGEIRNDSNTVYDDEGGVYIVHLENYPNIETRFLGLESFNSRENELRADGVRKSYNGEGTSFIDSTTLSQDLEPEYVILNDDGTKAYVTMQENNAIGILNLETEQWESVHGLGTKSYAENNQFDNKIDPSDRDEGINIKHYPIHAIYMPDGQAYNVHKGEEYLLIANEGASREYTVEDLGMDAEWEETDRGDDLFHEDLLSDAMPQSIIDMLNDTKQLGRLRFSVVDGLDSQGKIEKLHIFGGRSISAVKINPWGVVYDSGSDLEDNIAKYYPDAFNSDSRRASEKPIESKDVRSDNRGCEPEVIRTGAVGDDTLVFVGSERPGFITVFKINDEEEELDLDFESLYFGATFDKTWEEQFNDRTAHALDVEDLIFIPSDGSPDSEPLLVASGSITGSISFFRIVSSEDMNSAGSECTVENIILLLMTIISAILTH